MWVRDVMSSPAHTCAANDSVAAAAAMMDSLGCGCLPVVDEFGRPVGVLTDRDVCVAVARKPRFPSSILVREAMTTDPFTCPLSAEIGQALQIMSSCRVRRLPVVDGKGKLAGIISLTDVLESMKDALDSDVPLLRRTLASLRQIRRPRRETAGVPIPIEPITLDSFK